MPFDLRNSKSSCAYSSVLGLVAGSMIMALSMWFSESRPANACISSGLPMRMMSAKASAKAWSAAVSVRSSRLSGSTMRCLLLWARAMIFSIKFMMWYYLYICIICPSVYRAVRRGQNRPRINIRSSSSAERRERRRLSYAALMCPVSSLTTMASASVSWLMPLAARCRRPYCLGMSRS